MYGQNSSLHVWPHSGKLIGNYVYEFGNWDRFLGWIYHQFETSAYFKADANSLQTVTISFTSTILKDIYKQSLPDQLN
jgi:hypothetical protein